MKKKQFQLVKNQSNDFLERMQFMYENLSKSKTSLGPSKMWEELDRGSLYEARRYGFENFKRTLSRHYFANTPLWFLNRQTQFLVFHTNPITTLNYFIKSIFLPTHLPFSWIDSASYTFLTYMIWDYVLRTDEEKFLDKFEEPKIGNPPPIYLNNKLISQDIANSVLEFKSIFKVVKPESVKSILEIGAGSGRDAFVFIHLLKNIKKYIIVDLPPALATSERNLSLLFPDKRIFTYREFGSYKDIKEEFEKSNIAFFLPHQIKLLPSKMVDLTINISSLHEMKLVQIKEYFIQIERLTKKNKFFYFKEWKIAGVTHEDEVIKTEDYPIQNWKVIYLRNAIVQFKFFEQLLKLK